MTEHNILIIDGNTAAREILELQLLQLGAATLTASTLQEARSIIRQRETAFSLCLTESKLADCHGPELITTLHAAQPGLPVAIVTENTEISQIVAALKAGAHDYAQKPVTPSWLQTLLHSLAQSTATQAAGVPTSNTGTATVDKPIIGQSPAMKTLRQYISKLARSKAPVYIHGESGTGKELVAHEIHRLSTRHTAPFIPVNCGAIPENLVESEFFGHKKGSFTGANTDKQGLFAAADGGTLFLDEVADLPLTMQVKLLRAIQEGAIKAVGATNEHAVDVRILSATHKSLDDEVLQGRFRQDLYYRLNVIQLDVPPLRARGDDVLLLADFFLQKITRQWELPAGKLTAAAKKRLADYNFPGNVRELENILERACTLSESTEIEHTDLQLRQIQPSPPVQASHAMPQNSKAGNAPLHTDDELTIPDDVWNPEDANAERDLVARALDYTRWNRTRAARILGMTFRQLSYRIQKYGLDANPDQ